MRRKYTEQESVKLALAIRNLLREPTEMNDYNEKKRPNHEGRLAKWRRG